eukprot:6876182-Alexandrium_andersonii.AAC.1
MPQHVATEPLDRTKPPAQQKYMSPCAKWSDQYLSPCAKWSEPLPKKMPTAHKRALAQQAAI